jgi:trk system potassium uptake protein TrkH
MNRLYQKLPFFMELVFNGLFILMYSLYFTKQISITFISKELIEQILQIMSYFVPVFVFISILSFYKLSRGLDEFFRKYVFSLIVFVPMLMTIGDKQFTFWLGAVHLFSSMLSLYDTNSVQKNDFINQAINPIEKIKLAPAQIVILSFSLIIVIGTVLLSLPISAAEGKSISLIDAFFTATSATCVTGLSTLSLADNFSFVGQIIVLVLLQIGGLGYMTLHSSMMILLGKSFNIKNKVLMQDLLDISSVSDLLSMIVNIIRYTLVIELIGAIILSVAFSFEGYEIGESIYYGFFHSISAFCNAGFSLFNNSLENFGTNPFISLTISGLVILGGLGFIVLKELELVVTGKKKVVNLSVHSKVVLTTTFVLTSLVTVYIFFTEFLNAFSSYGLFDQFQLAFFQSVTTRTAGFNTMSLNALYPHTLYLFCLIMFIGASPGSTGGGIKTTTFAILFQSVKATLRGRDRVEFFDRLVPNHIVVRAIAIIVISLIMVSFFILLMMRIEVEHSFLSIFFEVVSAFATVGLSLGITPYLSAAGKVVIILLMFVGRIGPLTLALAIGKSRTDEGHVEYPTGRLLIG